MVQVGDKDFIDKSSAIEVLNDYMIDFEKRNPTLKAFNAVIHLDEETLHLHINFVSVAEGYKKGLMKSNIEIKIEKLRCKFSIKNTLHELIKSVFFILFISIF